MIFLIEGADNTGKTSLAKELEARGFKYLHFGVPEPDVDLFAEYANTLTESARRQQNVVIDRLHLAEWVYARVMRGGHTRVSEHQLRILNLLLHELGGYVVLCAAPETEVRDLWRQRADREYVKDEDKFRRVQVEYRQLMHSMWAAGQPFHIYDFTQHRGDPGGYAEYLINAHRGEE